MQREYEIVHDDPAGKRGRGYARTRFHRMVHFILAPMYNIYKESLVRYDEFPPLGVISPGDITWWHGSSENSVAPLPKGFARILQTAYTMYDRQTACDVTAVSSYIWLREARGFTKKYTIHHMFEDKRGSVKHKHHRNRWKGLAEDAEYYLQQQRDRKFEHPREITVRGDRDKEWGVVRNITEDKGRVSLSADGVCNLR